MRPQENAKKSLWRKPVAGFIAKPPDSPPRTLRIAQNQGRGFSCSILSEQARESETEIPGLVLRLPATLALLSSRLFGLTILAGVTGVSVMRLYAFEVGEEFRFLAAGGD